MTQIGHPDKAGQLRQEYLARINRVLDYIEANIDSEFSLETLAEVANFSRFHFHRIFRVMVGETLNRFIQRVRLEKAAGKLIYNPKMSITEIALDCGFSGSAAFARAFKEAFHMSASRWRSGGYLEESNIRKTKGKESQMLRNLGKDVDITLHYTGDSTIKQIWRMKMINKNEVQVEVKDMPEYHVAYVRHIGPYQGDGKLFENLFERLFKWAGPRGLLRFPQTQVMAVYHDDPDITAEENLRTSVCITAPEDTEVDGEIRKMTVPGGQFAVARFEISENEYQEAWDALYGAWLPESGYQPDDRLCYELFHNDPNQHPEHKHIFDICVPVKPL